MRTKVFNEKYHLTNPYHKDKKMKIGWFSGCRDKGNCPHVGRELEEECPP